MKEQIFKGEAAREWLLGGEGNRWIENNFQNIKIFRSKDRSPIWALVYQPNYYKQTGWIGHECWDGKTDECEVLIDPNGVQEIYLSRSRIYREELLEPRDVREDVREADSCIRITLPILIVQLNHQYHEKSFGRLGFAESLRVWINPESGLGK